MTKQGRDGTGAAVVRPARNTPQAHLSCALPAFPLQWNFTCSYGKARQGWDPVTLLCLLVCRALLCLLTGALCPA